MMTEKLDGSEAKVIFGDYKNFWIKPDGTDGIWADTIIRSETILPLEIKPDVEYIILEYETDKAFIGIETTIRIPNVEQQKGFCELFPDEIIIKRTPKDAFCRPPYPYAMRLRLPEEKDTHDILLAPTLAFRTARGEKNKITYTLQTKRNFVFSIACKLAMFIRGFHFIPDIIRLKKEDRTNPVRQDVIEYVNLVNADDNFVVVLDVQDMLGLLEPESHDFEFKSAQKSIKAQAIKQVRSEDEEDLIADLSNYIDWLYS